MKNNQNKCCGLLGALFGHKFVARYSDSTGTGAPTHIATAIKDITLDFIKSFRTERDASITKVAIAALQAHDKATGTYVKDVCTRCGCELHSIPSPDNRRIEQEL